MTKLYSHELDKCDVPSWHDVYMSFALKLSERSTCKRAKVGCVITSWDHNRVLAVGYNGNYSGGPNTCDSDKPGFCGCIHSEVNCLVKMDYNDHAKKRLYCKTSPCLQCAKLIINAGITWIMYSELYRLTDGIELLSKHAEVLRI